MAKKTLFLLLTIWNVLCDAYLAHEVKNFNCFNDYDKTFYCFWEVNATSKINCSDYFLLTYEERFSGFGECIPQDLKSAESTLNNKCQCQFKVNHIGALVVYNVTLKSNGKYVLNDSFILSNTVKPKTPSNITVNASDTNNVIVHWNDRYRAGDYLKNHLTYELQFSSKQDEREVKTSTVVEGKSNHEISKRLFKRGHDYLVKVRSIPNGKDYNGTCSEWSSTAEWHNDYGLSSSELLGILIPIISILIILLILLFHFGVKYCKKNWLDKIPDPAKSHLLNNKPLKSQKPWLKSDVSCDQTKKKQISKIVRNNWLYKLIFKVHKEYDCNDQGGTETDNPIYCVVQDACTRILVPETPDIASVVEIRNAENEKDAPGSNEKEYDDYEGSGSHVSELDTSVKNTLLSILKESDFVVESSFRDEMEKSRRQNPSSSWDGFSGFKDTWKKEDLCVECSDSSPESGYHSYEGNSYATDVQNKSRPSQLFSFGQFSGNQGMSQNSSLNSSLYKSFINEVCRSDIFMDTGYNSFANVMSGSEGQARTLTCNDQALPWCVSAVDNTGCHLWIRHDDPDVPLTTMNPYKLYYQFTLKPKSHQSLDVNQDLNRHSHAEVCPTSTQECSEYQSFSAAISQDPPSMSFILEPIDSSWVDSGYKPFECLLNENTSEVDNSGLFYGKEMEFQSGQSPQNDLEPCGTSDYTKTKDPGDESQIKDETNITSYSQSNTKMTYDDEIEDNAPYALTFDLSNHMWNASTMYENKESLCNSKSKSLLDISMNDNPSSDCINVIKSVSELDTVQDRLSFTEFHNEPCYQQLKFENMSYFLHPFSLKNTSEDSWGAATDLLVPEKILDKDGNLYMKFALLNVHQPKGNFDPGVCEL